MAALPGFLLLFAGFYGFAFGVTRLLLRRSSWQQYSLVAPWLTGPALLVLALSVVGYRDPIRVFPWQAWLVLASGWTISVAVLLWEWRELGRLLAARWQQGLIIGLPALVGGAVLLQFFPGNQWNDVSIPFVGEYLQYAELAASATGQHQGDPDKPASQFCLDHRQIRIGQDLMIAAVAEVAGRHPVQVIQPLAVLFRMQQTLVLGLVLFGMARSRRQWLAVFVVLLLEAVVAFEVISFSSSFFSSNCTMPLYALYLVWLACKEEFGVREAVVLVLMNLFFLITYPELLPIVKTFELLAIGVALGRGQGRRWLPLVLCNVALVVTHPLLILTKVQNVLHLLATSEHVGWGVLGNPSADSLQIIGTLLGLRHGYLPGGSFRAHPYVGIAFGVAVVVQIGVGLVILARKYRMALTLLAWAGLVVLVHARCVDLDNYYSEFKILAASYFLLLLGAAAALFASRPRWRLVGGAVLVIWITTSVRSTEKMKTTFSWCSYTVGYSQLRDAVEHYAGGRPVTALTMNREAFSVLNLISGETAVPLVAMTPLQKEIFRTHTLGCPRFAERTDLDGVLFQGLILVDAYTFKNGQPLGDGADKRFECRKVLTKVGGLTLCEGRIVPNLSTKMYARH